MNIRTLLCMTVLYTSSIMLGAAVQNPKTLPSRDLIQFLLHKYKMYNPAYARTWSTVEELQEIQGIEPSGPPAHKVCSDEHNATLCEILALFAGFKPIVSEAQNLIEDAFKAEPLLKLVFERQDHNFYILKVPVNINDFIYIFFNMADMQSQKTAVIEALYSIEERDPQQLLGGDDDYLEQAYVHGKLYGYPDQAIRDYVSPQRWQRAINLGDAWLSKYKNIGNRQLANILDQKVSAKFGDVYVKIMWNNVFP